MLNPRRLMVGIPSLVFTWAMANSLGVTGALTTATGLPDMDMFRIPGVPQTIFVTNDGAQKADELRKEITDLDAVKEIKGSVKKGLEEQKKAAEDFKNKQLPKATPPAATKAPQKTATVPKAGTPAKTSGPAMSASRSAAYIKKAKALPVKGRAPKTGYSRSMFGSAWTDDVTVEFGHNGCDTRNDILRRDLTKKTIKAGTHNCVVLSGVLADPYTGTNINFTRGVKTSSAVQIDHLVPLSEAWQKGAQSWSSAKRKNFANDPINLLASDGPSNSAKGDSDVATWLPKNKKWRCDYVALIIDVKAKYGVWVVQAEKDAMIRILQSRC